MIQNPVWRESMEIFFDEGHGFAVYVYLLTIFAPVVFLSLYIQSLDAQMWSGSASLFKVAAVTALLLIVYFTLRVANQEFAPWRFKTLRYWLGERGHSASRIGQGQLAFLVSHVGLSLLLCAPLLVWAGAISRTPMDRVAATFVLLAFYAVSYGTWGLAALALWERRLETRQVFIRCFFVALIMISALVYLPLNPVAYLLAYLGRQDLQPLALYGRPWSALTVHFTYHLLLGYAGYWVYRWALKREVPIEP
jgi:hypothetical protein